MNATSKPAAAPSSPGGTTGVSRAPTPPEQGIRRPGQLYRSLWQLSESGLRRQVLWGIGFRMLAAVCMGIPIWLLVSVLERLRQDALGERAVTGSDIAGWIGILAASVAGQYLFIYLSQRRTWTASYHLVGALRLRTLDRLRNLPMSFHANARAGDTSALLTKDLSDLEPVVSMAVPTLVGAVVLPIVVSVALLVEDWRMAVAAVVTIPVALAVHVWSKRLYRDLMAQRGESGGEAKARFLEYASGIAVVRANQAGGEKSEQLATALAEQRRVSLAVISRLILPTVAFSTIVELGLPVVLLTGVYLLAGGQLEATTFLVFVVLSLRLHGPLREVGDQTEFLRLGEAAIGRLAPVLNTPGTPAPAHPAEPSGADVELDGVIFTYPGQASGASSALRDVSFRAPAGSVTALVGASGSGKTTCLNLVARFWDADRGSVRIGGADVRDLPAERLFDAVTVVFQDVYLFTGTVRENIRFGRAGATDAEVEEAGGRANVDQIVERLPQGWDTPVGEGGASLSGGERQRISIARAILKDAPVVLLDEPTAAMDPATERTVQQAISELVADRTVLVVAHRLATIRTADQIVVLHEGAVVERGTHDELLARGGRYARLWSEQERARSWRVTT